jgi:two-component system sensor histidine kinase FlrB
VRQRDAQQSLAKAFLSFTNAAGSLESSYSQLQAEVLRLRHELERVNQDLNQSLAENKRIRTYLGCILECLPCGVLVVDADHRLKLVKPAAQALLSALSSSPAAPAGIAPEALEKLEALSGGPSAGAEREWPISTEEGPRSLAVSCVVLSRDARRDGERIFILRDITESKRLEKEREAARRTQDLAQMAMLLAHEVRNPLGSLELFAGLLAEGTEDRPVLRGWVEQLRAGLCALSATVINVLQFHSEPRTKLTPINLVSLLSETVEFLRPLARQREMRLDFSAGQPDILSLADAHRLQQVFINLALNAFRAMSPGGVLRLSVHCNRPYGELPIRIVFRDEGGGIPSEHLDQIFEAGFTTNPGSPGLGLALTQKVFVSRLRSLPGLQGRPLRPPWGRAEG